MNSTNVKLTLVMNEEVVAKMKEYAALHHSSISKIAENFFATLTKTKKSKKGNIEISPFVKSLSIKNIMLPSDFDYKKERGNYLEEKYS